jgi:hypothetical protein
MEKRLNGSLRQSMLATFVAVSSIPIEADNARPAPLNV